MYRILSYIFLLLLFFSCSSSKQKSFVQLDQLVQDSVKVNDKVDEVKSDKNETSPNYRHLTIRFKQHDTDVELTIDPLETNLELELKRTPDSEIDIEGMTENDDHGFINEEPGKKIAGNVNENTKEPEEAISDVLQKELEKDKDMTDDILADLMTAQTYFYQNKFSKALDVLQQSIDKKPTASAFALGGSIYYVNGEIDKAVHAWETALKINPDMLEIKNILTQVKK